MNNEKKYSKNHVWSVIKENMAVLGLSAYAKEKLGNIVFLNLPDIGEVFCEGDVFGDIETVKTVSDLIIPLNGEILEINEELLKDPEKMKEDVDNDWLVKVKVEKYSNAYMNEAEYKDYIKSL